MKTKIYLVRHTQTTGNVERRLTGRNDFELTEEGKKYSEYLAEELKNIKFDAAYSSTSKRTSKTIQKLADLNHLKIQKYERYKDTVDRLIGMLEYEIIFSENKICNNKAILDILKEVE